MPPAPCTIGSRITAARLSEFFLIISRIGSKSDGSHSSWKRQRGDGAKCRIGNAGPNAPCIPVTGSHTDMAFHVSP